MKGNQFGFLACQTFGRSFSAILVVIVIGGCSQSLKLNGQLQNSSGSASSTQPGQTPAPIPTQTPSTTPVSTPVLTSVTVSPSTASVAPSGTQQFSATAKDQGGNALSPQPSISWTVSGGGSISSTGLFTASASAGGPYTITATAGGSSVSGTATITISQPVVGCSSSAGLNTWQNITPPALVGADTFAFAIDPNHPGTVYLGTSQHGVWKTTNCGASWTGPINTGSGDTGSPGTPVAGSILNGSGGNGMMWAMTIDPTNSYLYTTIGYAALGLYKSRDGGVNWNQMLPSSILSITSNGFVNHISIDPTNNLHLVADFHVDACTGTAIPGAPVVVNGDFQNPVIVSYTQSTPTGTGTNYSGWACLAESHDGGVTWSLITAPAPWGGADGPGITVTNDKTWFFGQQGGKLWRTTTGGVAVSGQPAWTQVNMYVGSCSSGTNCTQPVTGSTGFVYIARDGSFYSGGNYSIIHSTDGVNWTSISGEYAPSLYDYNGLSIVVDTGTTLYAANNSNPEYFSGSISAIQNYTGTAPTSFMTKMPVNSAMSAGGPNVKQLGYDPVNHIVYSSNGGGGFWRMNAQ